MPAPDADPDADLSPEDIYRQRIAGRWSEAADCGGMTWNFQAESFTTPGEIHCAQVAVGAGGGGAVRIAGAECTGEGRPQPDMTLDAALSEDGSRIDVTGVGNAVDTPGWRRCE